jgi:hypothetical protein
MLDEGASAAVSEIGEAERIDKGDVSRILRLARSYRRTSSMLSSRGGGSRHDSGAAGAAAAGKLVRAAPVARRRTVAVGITFSAEDSHAPSAAGRIAGLGRLSGTLRGIGWLP